MFKVVARRCWLVAALILTACGSPHESDSQNNRQGPPVVAPSPRAQGVLVRLQQTHTVAPSLKPWHVSALPNRSNGKGLAVLLPGAARNFVQVGGWLRPTFVDRPSTIADPVLPATSAVPTQATGALQLSDSASGVSIAVSLEGTKQVAGEVANGYVVYPGAYDTNADVLVRPFPQGNEQSISFPSKPAAESATYEVTLGTGVRGIRLVANAVEFLDANGAPRLRMAPPFISGNQSTSGWPAVTVQNCAFDSSPVPPWRRAVTDPGRRQCTVVVDWSQLSIAYPALLDPTWSVGSAMATARMNHSIATITGAGGSGLLVFGGYAFNQIIASTEFFDPASGTWSEGPFLPTGVAYAAAVSLPNGNALAVGGFSVTSGTGTPQNTIYTYNAPMAVWSSPEPGAGGPVYYLNKAREGHTATLLPSGKVLVVGGFGQTSAYPDAELFDPTAGTSERVNEFEKVVDGV